VRKDRLVLWGWDNESNIEVDYVARCWTVPTKIWLDIDGKLLLQWPIEEIEALWKKWVGLP
jgi:beta-fructofuranosidase